MLRRLNIEVGQRLIIEGRNYVFTREITHEGAAPSDARDLGFTDVRTGAHLALSLEMFNGLYAAGQVRLLKAYEQQRDRPAEDPTLETAKALWRRLWCEAYDQTPCAKSEATLRELITQTKERLAHLGPPPAPGTLRVWLRNRGAAGDRRTRFMLDRRGTAAPGLRIEPLAQKLLAEKAEVFYDGVRINPQAVYFALRAAVVELNTARALESLPAVRPPSESTVRRYLKRHMDYGRAVRRYGWREGSRQFRPLRGSMQAKHILDIAIIDQTLIDCSVIDDEHMINVGRPWLAVMIDAHSRYPLGFCLTFEKPSVETVLACVRHAVRPKDEVKAISPPILGEWVGFGVPDTIVVDNAWENTGSSFRDACADANISIVFAPVATPEYKGICERYFHTLNTMLFHRLPGGLPFTPQQRTRLGLDNERDAALMLSDVKRAIYQCNIEVYGRHFHKALQASPEQVWRRDAAQHGRPYADDLAALDIALAKLVPADRTLSRAGVTYNDLDYGSPEPLAELLADLVPRAAGSRARPGTARVKVKYHPEDLSRVYVWNEFRSRYVVLPCTQRRYAAGLSEHHHKLIRAFAASEHLAFQSEDERCQARARLQNLILPAIPLSKVRDRQNAQRLKGDLPIEPLAGADMSPEHGVAIATLRGRSDAGAPHRAPRKGRAARSSVAGRVEPMRSHVEPAPREISPFGEWFETSTADPRELTAGPSSSFEEFFMESDGASAP